MKLLADHSSGDASDLVFYSQMRNPVASTISAAIKGDSHASLCAWLTPEENIVK